MIYIRHISCYYIYSIITIITIIIVIIIVLYASCHIVIKGSFRVLGKRLDAAVAQELAFCAGLTSLAIRLGGAQPASKHLYATLVRLRGRGLEFEAEV